MASSSVIVACLPRSCDKGLRDYRTINDDRHEESLLLGHVVGTLDGEIPLVPEIPLEPLLRVPGDNRYE